ncbi:MAG: hypothetical protein WBC60_19500 [Cognaticolwellia sp.]
MLDTNVDLESTLHQVNLSEKLKGEVVGLADVTEIPNAFTAQMVTPGTKNNV